MTLLFYESDSYPHILNTVLPTATAAIPYANTLYETGAAPGNLTWSFTGTLPPGLSLGMNSGTVSGTPTTAGTYIFKALVTDSAGNNGTQTLTLTIANAVVCTPPPSILVSWYMLDANANDYQGINNGTVVGSGSQFVPAEVGNGFQPGPQGSGGIIVVPDSPTLALSQFTFGAWV